MRRWVSWAVPSRDPVLEPDVDVEAAVAQPAADSSGWRADPVAPPAVERGDGYVEVVSDVLCGHDRSLARASTRRGLVELMVSGLHVIPVQQPYDRSRPVQTTALSGAGRIRYVFDTWAVWRAADRWHASR